MKTKHQPSLLSIAQQVFGETHTASPKLWRGDTPQMLLMTNEIYDFKRLRTLKKTGRVYSHTIDGNHHHLKTEHDDLTLIITSQTCISALCLWQSYPNLKAALHTSLERLSLCWTEKGVFYQNDKGTALITESYTGLETLLNFPNELSREEFIHWVIKQPWYIPNAQGHSKLEKALLEHHKSKSPQRSEQSKEQENHLTQALSRLHLTMHQLDKAIEDEAKLSTRAFPPQATEIERYSGLTGKALGLFLQHLKNATPPTDQQTTEQWIQQEVQTIMRSRGIT